MCSHQKHQSIVTKSAQFVETGCPEQLHDILVGLKDTWPTTNGSSAVAMDTICGTRDGPQTEARVVIECDENAIRRYLVIEIHEFNGVLTLCEVKVFAVQRK